MRTLSRAVIIGVAAIVALAIAPANAGDFWVIGVGLDSCGEYLKNLRVFRQNTFGKEFIAHTMEMAWVEGFITAENGDWTAAVAKKMGKQRVADYDMLKGLDVSSIEVWLENYCQAHPLDNLARASQDFTQELMKRHLKGGG